MAPEHQALKSLLQGEGKKSKVMNKHLADASAKDDIWLAEKIPHAGLSPWRELCRWKRGATQVQNLHQTKTWEVHPSPSDSTKLKSPLGGVL